MVVWAGDEREINAMCIQATKALKIDTGWIAKSVCCNAQTGIDAWFSSSPACAVTDDAHEMKSQLKDKLKAGYYPCRCGMDAAVKPVASGDKKSQFHPALRVPRTLQSSVPKQVWVSWNICTLNECEM